MPKLDDVSWHFGSDDYPSDLPEENAATHIGFFATWMIRNGHWGDELGPEAETKLTAVRDGHFSGRNVVLEDCDGKLLTEMLKAEIIPFAQSYYDKQYLLDYKKALVRGLKSDYLVENSEANYQKIATIIDQRHAKWLTGATRPKWKFW